MPDSLPSHVRQALNDYYVQTIREIAGRHAPHLLLVASVPDSAVATTGLREVVLPALSAAGMAVPDVVMAELGYQAWIDFLDISGVVDYSVGSCGRVSYASRRLFAKMLRDGTMPDLDAPFRACQAAMRQAHERSGGVIRTRVVLDDFDGESPDFDLTRIFLLAAKTKGAAATVRFRYVLWMADWSVGWQDEILGGDNPLFQYRHYANIADADAATLVPLDQDIADRIRRAAIDDLPTVLAKVKLPHAL